MKAFRWLGFALAVILLAGAGWLAWQQIGAPKKTDVRAVQLERKTLRATLRAIGNLSSRDELSLAAPLSSTIIDFPIQLGQTVNAGAALMQFDPQDFDAKQQALEAALRVVDQDVVSARREISSLRPVVVAGGAPRKSLQDARSRLTGALARQAEVIAAQVLGGRAGETDQLRQRIDAQNLERDIQLARIDLLTEQINALYALGVSAPALQR